MNISAIHPRRTFCMALALSAALCAPALAQPAMAPAEKAAGEVQNWRSLSDIATHLAENGFRVLEIEVERDRYEAELVDRDGNILDVRVNPTTGELLRSRTKGRANQPADPKWKTVAQIAGQLEKQGYIVRKVETEQNGYEVELTDRTGRHLDAKVNPETGDITRSKPD
ncbi:PepSY domain-containing protein [Xanthobacter sp. TB0139]|uniref:PepSY domain-containing protein n=1 Tax=Xanthobacter sp. TB0139 TaxID=3459178 RepID=UPI00403A226A